MKTRLNGLVQLLIMFSLDSRHGLKRFVPSHVGNINIQATCHGDRWNRRQHTGDLCAIKKTRLLNYVFHENSILRKHTHDPLVHACVGTICIITASH